MGTAGNFCIVAYSAVLCWGPVNDTPIEITNY